MRILFLSVIAYISTNMDDLVFNMIFFAQAKSAREARSIAAGKFLGMFFLTAVSLLGAYGLQTLSLRWLPVLSIVPIALGLRQLIRHFRGGDEDTHAAAPCAALWLSMAITTVAAGADNIGVYVPLFAGFTPGQQLVGAAVFAAMTALWCLLAGRLTRFPGFQKWLGRIQPIAVPIVYILLGLYILL